MTPEERATAYWMWYMPSIVPAFSQSKEWGAELNKRWNCFQRASRTNEVKAILERIFAAADRGDEDAQFLVAFFLRHRLRNS